MLDVYGIKNCDTVKKSLHWLHSNQVEVRFHDFKTESLSMAQVIGWAEQLGWDKLINRRGTTWRKLTDQQKALSDDQALAELVIANTSLIKRPLVEHHGVVMVGFDPEEWQRGLL